MESKKGINEIRKYLEKLFSTRAEIGIDKNSNLKSTRTVFGFRQEQN